MDPSLSRDIPDVWILYGVIVFSVFICLWEEYLSLRQRGVLRRTARVPDCISDRLSLETFERARSYNLDRSVFSSCHSLFEIVIGTVFLLYGMMPLMWALSADTLHYLGYSGEIAQSMVYIVYSTLLSVCIGVPWKVYSTFVLEERHNFNKQTGSFFVRDQVKSVAVSLCLSLPVVAAVVYIVRAGGDYFFLYLWLFCCLLMFLIMTIYPELIAPLFDKYTPLPAGQLRSKIEALASQLSFPLKKLYVVEGSKRSAHSNAYFYGFFNNKRIVLFDTLLANWDGDKNGAAATEGARSAQSRDSPATTATTTTATTDAAAAATANVTGKNDVAKGCSDDEVVAVLSHELGHWSLNHVMINCVVIQLNLLLTFVIFAMLYRFPALYRAFGFETTPTAAADHAPIGSSPASTVDLPVLPGLMIIMQHILAPYSTLIGVFMIRLSRRFEFQADRFGKSLGNASQLKSALLKLTSDNLGFPVYDEWYSAWHHSHPPLLQRLAALDKTD